MHRENRENGENTFLPEDGLRENLFFEFKKSFSLSTVDEYRSLVDKYANVRNDFEKRMTDSCQRFQETEEHHLRQMKDFVDTYAKAWEHQHALVGQVLTALI